MKDYISIQELLKKAEEKGIYLGKGDPYNRIRYYTKMGWIPHMVRKKGQKGATKGHLPLNTLERLQLIEKYKEQGMTNDEIASKLTMKDRASNFYSVIMSGEIRNKVITYASFSLLLLLVLTETGYIQIGRAKNSLLDQNTATQTQKQIVDVGSGFITAGSANVFVRSNKAFDNSNVQITFKGDYSPATRYWVTITPSQSGFSIELDSPVSNNAEFDWWIVN